MRQNKKLETGAQISHAARDGHVVGIDGRRPIAADMMTTA
jgi:hypothetical protein